MSEGLIQKKTQQQSPYNKTQEDILLRIKSDNTDPQDLQYIDDQIQKYSKINNFCDTMTHTYKDVTEKGILGVFRGSTFNKYLSDPLKVRNQNHTIRYALEQLSDDEVINDEAFVSECSANMENAAKENAKKNTVFGDILTILGLFLTVIPLILDYFLPFMIPSFTLQGTMFAFITDKPSSPILGIQLPFISMLGLFMGFASKLTQVKSIAHNLSVQDSEREVISKAKSKTQQKLQALKQLKKSAEDNIAVQKRDMQDKMKQMMQYVPDDQKQAFAQEFAKKSWAEQKYAINRDWQMINEQIKIKQAKQMEAKIKQQQIMNQMVKNKKGKDAAQKNNSQALKRPENHMQTIQNASKEMGLEQQQKQITSNPRYNMNSSKQIPTPQNKTS